METVKVVFKIRKNYADSWKTVENHPVGEPSNYYNSVMKKIINNYPKFMVAMFEADSLEMAYFPYMDNGQWYGLPEKLEINGKEYISGY